jgi:hypothetical protein
LILRKILVRSLRRRVWFNFLTQSPNPAPSSFVNSKFSGLIQDRSINGSAFR